MKRTAALAAILAAALTWPALAGADGHISVTVIVDSHRHDREDIHPAYRPDRFHRPRVVIHHQIHRFPDRHAHVPRHHHRFHGNSHGGWQDKRTATVNMP